MNIVSDANYPYWKTLVWRGARTAFNTQIVATIAFLAETDFYRLGLDDLKILAITVVFSFLAGFSSSFFKFLRDKLSEGNKNALIQKLPL